MPPASLGGGEPEDEGSKAYPHRAAERVIALSIEAGATERVSRFR